ncbi:UNVERIFIED_ORG: hypothetical protein J2W85_006305 [Ensifer adhaerens]|nr:hypothetical protein [Ensifer adhaerens]
MDERARSRCRWDLLPQEWPVAEVPIAMWPFEDDVYPEGYLLPVDVTGTPLRWRDFGRRHGVAVLHYGHYGLFAADNVRLPDGARGRVRLAPQGPHWRRPLNDHNRAWSSAAVAIPVHWRWGTLTIGPDDVVFEDDQSLPEYMLQGRNERLDYDLCQSSEIRNLALTMEGCNALYGLLVERHWARSPDDESCSYTRKGAARLLAKIRGLGETFYDFTSPGWLCYRGYAAEHERISRQLERLGWHDVTEKPASLSADGAGASDGMPELLRTMALFVVGTMVAFFILLAITILAPV